MDTRIQFRVDEEPKRLVEQMAVLLATHVENLQKV
jgi:hypothetical protein